MTAPHSTSLAAGALLALATTACGTSAMQTDAPPQGGYEERPNETQRGAKPPVPRRNPHAVPYEVTMTIEDAPGPFAVVKAAMQYEVLNERCLPRLGGMAGTRVSAVEWVEIELAQIAPQTYRGRFYDDLMVDEDYFGLGVCHWSLVTTVFQLRATGAEGETKFSEHLFYKDLMGNDPIRTYYWKGYYPRASLDDFPEGGERDASKFKPELRDELFVLDFSIRKVAP